MLCSVVLPVYNKASTIVEALESVLRQSHPLLEAIVVDDGSPDDSIERVLRLDDPRIRLIRQANSGVSCARNAGIAAARGELVCFLDADDVWHPHFLACVTRLAQAHPDRVFFSTAYRLDFSGDPQAVLPRIDMADLPPAIEVRDFYRSWRKQTLLCTNTVAIRRHALQALQPCFAPGESLAEDLDLWFRLFERHGLLHLPLALSAYRRGQESSLTSLEPQRLAGTGVLPAFQRLEQRARSKQLPPALRTDALLLVADKHVSEARRLLKLGQRGPAMRYLLCGWHGLMLPRWWFTLLLGLTAKPSWVAAWDRWRLLHQLAAQAQRDTA